MGCEEFWVSINFYCCHMERLKDDDDVPVYANYTTAAYHGRSLGTDNDVLHN